MAESGNAHFEADTAITGPRIQRFKPVGVRPQSAPLTKAGGYSNVSSKSFNLLDLDEDDPPYPLVAKKGEHVGVCVIFNVINFSVNCLKKREGSEKDGKEITKVFRKFSFEVKEMLDPTKAKMEQCLKQMAKNYQKEWTCFVCFLLSHGDSEDVLRDTNGRHVRVSDLVSCLSTKACPQMAGKPKLFFAQMCRGGDYQEGVPVSGFEADGSTSDTPIPPDEADMLVSFGTTPGYLSFRNPREGSAYIQILLQMLSRFGEKHDICSVLRRTTKLVGRLDFMGGYKMCPCYFSTLCRPLMFSNHLENSEEDFVNQMGSLNISHA